MHPHLFVEVWSVRQQVPACSEAWLSGESGMLLGLGTCHLQKLLLYVKVFCPILLCASKKEQAA